jgi:telomere length regulation protein
LKNEPDYDSLISTLRFLLQTNVEFNIASPSPEVAQVVHVLVSETVPNYWDVLRKSPQKKSPKHGNLWLDSDLGLLVSCLRSVTGLNAILLGLKQHTRQSKETKKSLGGSNTQGVVTVLLQVLQATLEGNKTINIIWESIYGSFEPTAKENALWQEFMSLIGGGKVLSISAEAEDVINSVSTSIGEKHWVANGSRYSLWLARNISSWANALGVDSDIGFTNCSLLLGKSLRLGHTGIEI